MANIDKLIKDLQSDSIEIRYNACKQLGNEQDLSKEAIKALRVAASDPEPLIAATANKALGNYEGEATPIPLNEYSRYIIYNDYQQSSGIDWEKIFLIGSSALIASLSIIGMFNLSLRNTPFYSEKLDEAISFGSFVPLILFCGLFIFSSILASTITASIISFWGHRMNTIMRVLLSLLMGAICGIGLYVISIYYFWS